MPSIPPELRKYAEEGLYIAVGASIAGAVALRRRLREVPVADEAATAIGAVASQVLEDAAREAIGAVRRVRALVELFSERSGRAGDED